MTDISTDSESVATQTVSEFFDGIARRTIVVRENMETQYIYGGHARDDDARRVVALYHSQYGGRLTLDYDACQAENAWSVVEDESGGVKCVEPIVLNLMQSVYDRTVQVDELGEEVTKLQDRIGSATRDFDQLNKFLNEYADSDGVKFCEEYERRLEEWNESLAFFKLLGRPRDWTVGVRIREQYESRYINGYIDVKAQSEELAKSLAAQLSPAEVFRLLAAHSSSFDVEIV